MSSRVPFPPVRLFSTLTIGVTLQDPFPPLRSNPHVFSSVARLNPQFALTLFSFPPKRSERSYRPVPIYGIPPLLQTFSCSHIPVSSDSPPPSLGRQITHVHVVLAQTLTLFSHLLDYILEYFVGFFKLGPSFDRTLCYRVTKLVPMVTSSIIFFPPFFVETSVGPTTLRRPIRSPWPILSLSPRFVPAQSRAHTVPLP